MSERGKDKGNQLTKKVAPTRESPRIKRVGPINYTEVDISDSGMESEGTIVASESGFGSTKLERQEDRLAQAQ